MTGKVPSSSKPTTKNRGYEEFGDLRKGTLHGKPFQAVRVGMLWISRLLIGLRVEGPNNVPASGGIMVVSNHLSNADPLLVSIAFPREIHFMSKKELFDIPFVRNLLRLFGEFPVDRGSADRWAIRRSQETMKQGICLGMFPEGTRSKTGGLKEAMAGAGMIGLRGDVPILPVAIVGTERLPFFGKRLPSAVGKGFRGAHIVIGVPFTLPREVDGKRLSADAATDLMMKKIAELLPESYRGKYADEIPGSGA